MTNINPNTGKRKRATPQEMLERRLAEIAKLEAKIAGTYTPSEDTYGLKRLRAAKRRRETLLSRAQTMLVGRAGTDKSPSTNSIAAKIENAQKRLADLIQSKQNAEERIANLPFDIERLAKLIERAETGEEVEMPTDLFPIPGEGEGTDAEHEVAAGEPSED